MLNRTNTPNADFRFAVFEAGSISAETYSEKEYSWTEFVDKLRYPERKEESVDEAQAQENVDETQECEGADEAQKQEAGACEQKDAKPEKAEEVGVYFGGVLKDGKLSKENVLSRTLLCLNVKEDREQIWSDWQKKFGYAAVLYSAASGAAEKPCLKLAVPLAKPVAPARYAEIVQTIVQELGRERFAPALTWCDKIGQTLAETFRKKYNDPVLAVDQAADWPAADGGAVLQTLDGAAMLDPDKVTPPAPNPHWFLRLLILAALAALGFYCYNKIARRPVVTPPSIDRPQPKHNYVPQRDVVIAAVTRQKPAGRVIAVFETTGLLNERFELLKAVKRTEALPQFKEKETLKVAVHNAEQALLSRETLKKALRERLFPAGQEQIGFEQVGDTAGFALSLSDWEARVQDVKDNVKWNLASGNTVFDDPTGEQLLKYLEERGLQNARSLLFVFDDGQAGYYTLVCTGANGRDADTVTRYVLKEGFKLAAQKDFDEWADERLNCSEAGYKIVPAVYPYRGGCSYVVSGKAAARYAGKTGGLIKTQFVDDLLDTAPAQWGVK